MADRQQPISIPNPSRPVANPSQITVQGTPNLNAPARNRGLEIVKALSVAVGVAVKVQESDDNEAYDQRNEEIEKAQTHIALARNEGDSEGVALLTRRLADMYDKGATDKNLTSKQRVQFRNGQQALLDSDHDLTLALQKERDGIYVDQVNEMGDYVKAALDTTLLSKKSLSQLAMMDVDGGDLLNALQPHVIEEIRKELVDNRGLDEAAVDELLAASPTLVSDIVNDAAGRISKIREANAVQADKIFKQQRNNAVANNTDLSTAGRVGTLRGFGKTHGEAVKMVQESTRRRASQGLVQSADQLLAVSQMATDPTLQFSSSQTKNIGLSAGQKAIEFVAGDADAYDFASGVVLEKADQYLRDFGIALNTESGKYEAVGTSGYSDTFLNGFLEPFNSLVSEVVGQQVVAFSSSKQAGQSYNSMVEALLAPAQNFENGTAWVASDSMVRKMHEQSVGLMDEQVTGRISGGTLNDWYNGAKIAWEQAGNVFGSEEHLEFIRATATIMSTFLGGSSIIPDGIETSLIANLSDGGVVATEYAMTILNNDPKLRERVLLSSSPDVRYGLKEMERARERGEDVESLVQGNSSEQMLFYRQEYRELTKQMKANSLGSEGQINQGISEAFRDLTGATVFDEAIFSQFGPYLVATRQLHDDWGAKKTVKHAIKLAEADGLKQFTQYSVGGLTAGMSTGQHALPAKATTDMVEIWGNMSKTGQVVHDRFTIYNVGQAIGPTFTQGAFGFARSQQPRPKVDGQEAHPDNFGRDFSPTALNVWFDQNFPQFHKVDRSIQDQDDVPGDDTRKMAQVLSGDTTIGSVVMSQRESQATSGGVMLEFTFEGPEGTLPKTRTLQLTAAQFDALNPLTPNWLDGITQDEAVAIKFPKPTPEQAAAFAAKREAAQKRFDASTFRHLNPNQADATANFYADRADVQSRMKREAEDFAKFRAERGASNARKANQRREQEFIDADNR